MNLSQTITKELFQTAEKQTFQNLTKEIEFIKNQKHQKLNELSSVQNKVNALISQLHQTTKIIDIQKQQISAEFELHLKTLQQQTVSNLNTLKVSLDKQLEDIKFD